MPSAEARVFSFNMIFSIQRRAHLGVTNVHPLAPLLLSIGRRRPTMRWAVGHIGRRLSPTAARTSPHPMEQVKPLYHPIEQATVGITTRWPLSMAQHLHLWRQRRRSTREPERVECGLDGGR